MQKFILLILTHLALVAVLSACAKPQTTSGTVLRQDDFSNAESGWQAQFSPDSESKYTPEGKFAIQVLGSQLNVWSLLQDFSAEEVTLTLEASSPSGALENGFGVLCRFQDADNFYFFLISSDGYYAIGERIQGSTTYLHDQSGDMSPNAAVKPAPQLNLLRVTCLKNKLSFEINGALAAKVQPSKALPAGNVGLLAKSLFEGNVLAEFDNITITQP